MGARTQALDVRPARKGGSLAGDLVLRAEPGGSTVVPRSTRSGVPRSARAGVPAGDSSEPLVTLNARVPKHLWRRVRLRCLEEGRLLRAFITEALREHLREQKKRR